MPALLSFQGRLRPLPYAAAALGVLAVQSLAVVAAFGFVGRPVEPGWVLVLAPLRAVVEQNRYHQGQTAFYLVELVVLAVMVLLAWVQAALAFRRAVDAGVSGLYATAAVAPVLQLPTVVILALLPSRAAPPPAEDPAIEAAWPAAAKGVLAGTALVLLAVAIGALVTGTYGYGLFVISPFLIGAVTGYLANHRGDLGGGRTARLVVLAALLGGAALVLAALEGIVCLVMAAPLALGVALLGGVLGRAAAVHTDGSARHAFVVVAVLPMVFASEQLVPSSAVFDTEETIEIAAPADAVWRALVRMEEIAVPPALPFRLGVAYPLRGEVVGEGVGALRIGVFSTGVAHERVTAWEPGRLLAFAVEREPPAMRELSPYAHVHAPHITGYFRTLSTSFALEPLGDGRTRVRERTTHALELEPLPYWLPLARWIVHLNNRRVLAHVRDQAERSAAGRQAGR